MKKKIITMIIICLILLGGIGAGACSDKKEDKEMDTSSRAEQETISVLEQLQDDYVYLGLNRTYIDIYTDTCYRNVDFYIYTTKKIEDVKKVTGKIDGFKGCDFNISENYEEIEFPNYVYECYKNMDWKEVYKLWKEDEEQYNQKLEEYQEGYETSKDKVKKLYCYEGCFGGIDSSKITSENSEFKVSHVVINIDGKDYNCQLAGLRIINDKIFANETMEESKIELKYVGNSPKNIDYSEEGEVTVDGLEFTCNEDITLKDIKLINREDCKVKERMIEIDSNGDVINTILKDGKALECKKGDKVTAQMKLEDEKFKGQLEYSTVYYFEIIYDYKNKEYIECFETGYATRTNAYEILGKTFDNINIDSFYTDYFNKAVGEEK